MESLELSRLHLPRYRAIRSHRLDTGGHGEHPHGAECLAAEAEAEEQAGSDVLQFPGERWQS